MKCHKSLNSTRKMSLLLFIVLSIFAYQATGFAWDQVNVERIFHNSDDIFHDLPVDPSEKQCVDQFKNFIDDLKSNKEWAEKSMDLAFISNH